MAWHNTSGAPNGGTVRFEPLGDNPQGFVENVGDALGFVSRRVEGDLERFKTFIESRGTETGAWRGEIHGSREVGRS